MKKNKKSFWLAVGITIILSVGVFFYLGSNLNSFGASLIWFACFFSLLRGIKYFFDEVSKEQFEIQKMELKEKNEKKNKNSSI